MRILCITSQRASITNVRPEAEIFIGLQAAGCSVTVMTEGDSDYLPRMQDAGIEVIDFASSGKFDRRAIAAIGKQLPGKDIVYAFNNNAIANTVRAARGLPVKVVTYRGQTGNISRWDPTAYLTHLHPRVDAIICVADAVRASIACELRDPTKAVTVYKGHDLDWYDNTVSADLSAYGIGSEDVTVLCVSNYRPRKGIETLIEAFDGLDASLHLVLAGSGTDSKKLAQLAARHLPATRFHALGFKEEVLPLTAACDIAVLPALRREGLPKTVIEAMVCAKPAIVTDTGGNAELVEHGQTGLVVPPANVGALRAAIAELAADTARREAMGVAGRERIDTHFNARDTVRDTLAVFERLLHQDLSRCAR